MLAASLKGAYNGKTASKFVIFLIYRTRSMSQFRNIAFRTWRGLFQTRQVILVVTRVKHEGALENI